MLIKLVNDKIYILQPLNIDDFLYEKNLSQTIYDKKPNIVFTHDFISSEIAEFNIASKQNVTPYLII